MVLNVGLRLVFGCRGNRIQKKEEKSCDFSSKVVYRKILSNTFIEALERIQEYRRFSERNLQGRCAF